MNVTNNVTFQKTSFQAFKIFETFETQKKRLNRRYLAIQWL